MQKSVGAIKQLQRRALESLRRGLGDRRDHD
jgi:DNA-directed RNA polymerase specialized sigma24 family protein